MGKIRNPLAADNIRIGPCTNGNLYMKTMGRIYNVAKAVESRRNDDYRRETQKGLEYESKGLFVCEECNYESSARRTYFLHILTHVGERDKLQCSNLFKLCNNSSLFQKSDSWGNFVDRHLLCMPVIACKIEACLFESHLKQRFIDHMKKHHKVSIGLDWTDNLKWYEIQREVIPPPEKYIPLPHDNVLCRICGERFFHNSALVHHLIKKHTEKGGFNCPYNCKYTPTSCEGFEFHLNNTHKMPNYKEYVEKAMKKLHDSNVAPPPKETPKAPTNTNVNSISTNPPSKTDKTTINIEVQAKRVTAEVCAAVKLLEIEKSQKNNTICSQLQKTAEHLTKIAEEFEEIQKKINDKVQVENAKKLKQANNVLRKNPARKCRVTQNLADNGRQTNKPKQELIRESGSSKIQNPPPKSNELVLVPDQVENAQTNQLSHSNEKEICINEVDTCSETMIVANLESTNLEKIDYENEEENLTLGNESFQTEIVEGIDAVLADVSIEVIADIVEASDSATYDSVARETSEMDYEADLGETDSNAEIMVEESAAVEISMEENDCVSDELFDEVILEENLEEKAARANELLSLDDEELEANKEFFEAAVEEKVLETSEDIATETYEDGEESLVEIQGNLFEMSDELEENAADLMDTSDIEKHAPLNQCTTQEKVDQVYNEQMTDLADETSHEENRYENRINSNQSPTPVIPPFKRRVPIKRGRLEKRLSRKLRFPYVPQPIIVEKVSYSASPQPENNISHDANAYQRIDNESMEAEENPKPHFEPPPREEIGQQVQLVELQTTNKSCECTSFVNYRKELIERYNQYQMHALNATTTNANLQSSESEPQPTQNFTGLKIDTIDPINDKSPELTVEKKTLPEKEVPEDKLSADIKFKQFDNYSFLMGTYYDGNDADHNHLEKKKLAQEIHQKNVNPKFDGARGDHPLTFYDQFQRKNVPFSQLRKPKCLCHNE